MTFPVDSPTSGAPIDAVTVGQGETADSVESKILELLYDDPERAYDCRETAIEVMGEGRSERDVERPSDMQTFMAEFLDVATVSTILERLADDQHVVRRLVDAGRGKRSYYRAPESVPGRSE